MDWSKLLAIISPSSGEPQAQAPKAQGPSIWDQMFNPYEQGAPMKSAEQIKQMDADTSKRARAHYDPKDYVTGPTK